MGAGLVWECPRDDFSDASSSRGISYSVGAPPGYRQKFGSSRQFNEGSEN
jgi:hypothetical protein